MCGISGIFGKGWQVSQLEAMIAAQRHRGPDDEGKYVDPCGCAALGHNRLSIIDRSPAGHQPMRNPDGSLWLAFNGEIYNAPELRAELSDYPYRSNTDTEVILAAYERWGTACLDRLIGMFAFLLWDARSRSLFAARDRFGVKPLYYHAAENGAFLFASEIKALHAAGAGAGPDAICWASYLAHGLYDHSERTFWRNIRALPAGHFLTWREGQAKVSRWYDLQERIGDALDERPFEQVAEEYTALLRESVRLRFRSDVPVGFNLSGGLDSSLLLSLADAVQGRDSRIQVFTFVTGDPHYDELPWVLQMLAGTAHPLAVCTLQARDVPALAASVQSYQDEPFGGLPTLAYARVFEESQARGVVVLLDGQGMDEQWAGYDYYVSALHGQPPPTLQGAVRPVRPECLAPEFLALAEPWTPPQPFPDGLRNAQYRDARYTKIPRALRFNDRISMRASTELREPFLDHRLFELALRQPPDRKINGARKWLLRRIAGRLVPQGIAEAPKRPLQTPQREWLRGPLREWAQDSIEQALALAGGSWLLPDRVRAAWRSYLDGMDDNSFYIWQWISLGMMRPATAPPQP
jgi:asparagine synthase (glutamine-hydrolysing)